MKSPVQSRAFFIEPGHLNPYYILLYEHKGNVQKGAAFGR